MAARIRRPYTETRERIEIEGNAVKVVTERVNKVIKLDDFLTAIGNNAGVVTPILPNGCRFFRSKQSHSVLVIEKPPQMRQLNWVGMHSDTTKTSWKLAFPYTVFVLDLIDLAFNRSFIFYRTTPLSSPDDRLFHSNLCNVDGTGIICTGNIRAAGNSITEKADNFIAAFWASQFNTDLMGYNFTVDSRSTKQVSSLETWQKSSKEDPLFPLSVTWREYDSVANIVGNRFREL